MDGACDVAAERNDEEEEGNDDVKVSFKVGVDLGRSFWKRLNWSSIVMSFEAVGALFSGTLRNGEGDSESCGREFSVTPGEGDNDEADRGKWSKPDEKGDGDETGDCDSTVGDDANGALDRLTTPG